MFKRDKINYLFDISIVITGLTLHTLFDNFVLEVLTPLFRGIFGEDNLRFVVLGRELDIASILGAGAMLAIVIGIIYHLSNKYVEKSIKKKKVKEIEIPEKEIENIVERKMNAGQKKQENFAPPSILPDRQFQMQQPQQTYYY